MNYNKKDILLGVVIIIIIVLGVLFYRRLKLPKVNNTTSTPVSIQLKEEIENSFKYDIEDDLNTIELKDVSNGDGRGIATRKEVLADIVDPDQGYFYQGWLEQDGKFISLGKLKMAKGGWLVEYDGDKYPEYKKLIISLEKTLDTKIEKRVLEGSF